MKFKFLKHILPLFTAIYVSSFCMAQTTGGSATAPIFTANSLASGNYKDILTSFFQLAFDNLTGPQKSLHFNSNPFAIMLLNNPKLATDRDYYKYRALRKLNFSFGLSLDTSYRFNGFTAGIKYALINKRDSTTSRLLFNNLQQDSLNAEMNNLRLELLKYMEDSLPAYDSNNVKIEANIRIRNMLNTNLNKMFSFSPYTSFNQLDSGFQKTIIQIAKENNLTIFLQMVNSNPAVSMQKTLDDTFTGLKKAIKSAPLWTISVTDTVAKNQLLFSNIVVSTEFSKGVFKLKPGSNLELNIKASVRFTDDALQPGNDLKRSIFNFDPGINWVIRNKSNDYSLFEFKLGGSYIHQFSSLYANEKRNNVMFNGLFRVRVISDIWIPLEFRYDPRNGNVFGFLSVKANFTGLGKMLSNNSP